MQTFNSSDTAWRLTAWIAGVFTLLLGTALIFSHFGGRDRDPWRSPQLLAQKEQLRNTPKDEAVKERIRELDLSLRQRYFRQLSRMDTGVYLLLGGTALFGFACARVLRGRKSLPALNVKPESQALMKTAGFSRWAVGATGAVVGGSLFLAGLGFSTVLPANTAQIDKLLGANAETSSAPDAASLAELANNWPHFLGARAGWAASSSAPTNWDAATGANIAWKTPSPAMASIRPWFGATGFHSPAATRPCERFTAWIPQRERCYGARPSPMSPGPRPNRRKFQESTGYAAPTMATDGRRVYVMYANGDLAALSMEGRVLWAKGFGALKNTYGHANLADDLARPCDRAIGSG